MRLLAFAALLLAACSSPPAPAAADAGVPLSLDNVDAKDPKALLAAVDQMAGHLKDKPKTFEVLAALGNLYYENSRYLDAVDTYRQALEKAAAADAEAAALRGRGVKAAAALPLECRRSGPSYGLEQIAAVARKTAAADAPTALRCYEEALGMAVASRARRGNALYLIGNPDAALAEHERVLLREPDHPESLFFVGAILLEKSRTDPTQREPGKQRWSRLLEVAPDHPRAALVRENLPKVDQLFAPPQADAGPPPLPANHPPVATPQSGPTAEQVQNVAEAVKNTERTPALEKSLDETLARGEALLDEGKFQDARSALIQVMAMRPDSPQVAAALGGTMRGLGNLPMAERVLGRALQLDARSPRANYELGMLLAGRGDKQAAAQHLQISLTDPAFASKHKITEELARLR